LLSFARIPEYFPTHSLKTTGFHRPIPLSAFYHSLEGIVSLWNNQPVQTEVIVTDEFVAWWDGLTVEEQKSIAVSVGLLQDFGVLLSFPHSSAIEGASKLRELRIQHHGEPYRVLYAFDPARNAVLLIGGNKTGKERWYEQNVPLAERIFAAYLQRTRQ
jgi:hypothetical protein